MGLVFLDKSATGPVAVGNQVAARAAADTTSQAAVLAAKANAEHNYNNSAEGMAAADAAREEAKRVAAFSQPRVDTFTPSTRYLEITRQYAQQHYANVSSSGTMIPTESGMKYISGSTALVGKVFQANVLTEYQQEAVRNNVFLMSSVAAQNIVSTAEKVLGLSPVTSIRGSSTLSSETLESAYKTTYNKLYPEVAIVKAPQTVATETVERGSNIFMDASRFVSRAAFGWAGDLGKTVFMNTMFASAQQQERTAFSQAGSAQYGTDVGLSAQYVGKSAAPKYSPEPGSVTQRFAFDEYGKVLKGGEFSPAYSNEGIPYNTKMGSGEYEYLGEYRYSSGEVVSRYVEQNVGSFVDFGEGGMAFHHEVVIRGGGSPSASLYMTQPSAKATTTEIPESFQQAAVQRQIKTMTSGTSGGSIFEQALAGSGVKVSTESQKTELFGGIEKIYESSLEGTIKAGGSLFAATPVLSDVYKAGRVFGIENEIKTQSKSLEEQYATYQKTGIITKDGSAFTGTQEQYADFVAKVNRIEVLQGEVDKFSKSGLGLNQLVTGGIHGAVVNLNDWWESASKQSQENANTFGPVAGALTSIGLGVGSVGIMTAGMASAIPATEFAFRDPSHFISAFAATAPETVMQQVTFLPETFKENPWKALGIVGGMLFGGKAARVGLKTAGIEPILFSEKTGLVYKQEPGVWKSLWSESAKPVEVPQMKTTLAFYKQPFFAALRSESGMGSPTINTAITGGVTRLGGVHGEIIQGSLSIDNFQAYLRRNPITYTSEDIVGRINDIRKENNLPELSDANRAVDVVNKNRSVWIAEGRIPINEETISVFGKPKEILLQPLPHMGGASAVFEQWQWGGEHVLNRVSPEKYPVVQPLFEDILGLTKEQISRTETFVREPYHLQPDILIEGFKPKSVSEAILKKGISLEAIKKTSPEAYEIAMNDIKMLDLAFRQSSPPAINNPETMAKTGLWMLKDNPSAIPEFFGLLKKNKDTIVGGSFLQAVYGYISPENIKDLELYTNAHAKLGRDIVDYFQRQYPTKQLQVSSDYEKTTISIERNGHWAKAFEIHNLEFAGKEGGILSQWGLPVDKPMNIDGVNYMSFREQMMRKISSTMTMKKDIRGNWIYSTEHYGRAKDFADAARMLESIAAVEGNKRFFGFSRNRIVDSLMKSSEIFKSMYAKTSTYPEEFKTVAEERYTNQRIRTTQDRYFNLPGTSRWYNVEQGNVLSKLYNAATLVSERAQLALPIRFVKGDIPNWIEGEKHLVSGGWGRNLKVGSGVTHFEFQVVTPWRAIREAAGLGLIEKSARPWLGATIERTGTELTSIMEGGKTRRSTSVTIDRNLFPKIQFSFGTSQYLEKYYASEIAQMTKEQPGTTRFVSGSYVPGGSTSRVAIPVIRNMLAAGGDATVYENLLRWMDYSMANVGSNPKNLESVIGRSDIIQKVEAAGKKRGISMEISLARELLEPFKKFDERGHAIGGTAAEAAQMGLEGSVGDIDAYSTQHRIISEAQGVALERYLGKENVKVTNKRQGSSVSVFLEGKWEKLIETHLPEMGGATKTHIGRLSLRKEAPIVVNGYNLIPIRELAGRKASAATGIYLTEQGTYGVRPLFNAGDAPRWKDIGGVATHISEQQRLRNAYGFGFETKYLEGIKTNLLDFAAKNDESGAARAKFESAKFVEGKEKYINIPLTRRYIDIEPALATGLDFATRENAATILASATPFAATLAGLSPLTSGLLGGVAYGALKMRWGDALSNAITRDERDILLGENTKVFSYEDLPASGKISKGVQYRQPNPFEIELEGVISPERFGDLIKREGKKLPVAEREILRSGAKVFNLLTKSEPGRFFKQKTMSSMQPIGVRSDVWDAIINLASSEKYKEHLVFGGSKAGELLLEEGVGKSTKLSDVDIVATQEVIKSFYEDIRNVFETKGQKGVTLEFEKGDVRGSLIKASISRGKYKGLEIFDVHSTWEFPKAHEGRIPAALPHGKSVYIASGERALLSGMGGSFIEMVSGRSASGFLPKRAKDFPVSIGRLRQLSKNLLEEASRTKEPKTRLELLESAEHASSLMKGYQKYLTTHEIEQGFVRLQSDIVTESARQFASEQHGVKFSKLPLDVAESFGEFHFQSHGAAGLPEEAAMYMLEADLRTPTKFKNALVDYLLEGNIKDVESARKQLQTLSPPEPVRGLEFRESVIEFEKNAKAAYGGKELAAFRERADQIRFGESWTAQGIVNTPEKNYYGLSAPTILKTALAAPYAVSIIQDMLGVQQGDDQRNMTRLFGVASLLAGVSSRIKRRGVGTPTKTVFRSPLVKEGVAIDFESSMVFSKEGRGRPIEDYQPLIFATEEINISRFLPKTGKAHVADYPAALRDYQLPGVSTKRALDLYPVNYSPTNRAGAMYTLSSYETKRYESSTAAALQYSPVTYARTDVADYPQAYPQVYPRAYPQAYPQVYPRAYPRTYPAVYPKTYTGTYPGSYPKVTEFTSLQRSYTNTTTRVEKNVIPFYLPTSKRTDLRRRKGKSRKSAEWYIWNPVPLAESVFGLGNSRPWITMKQLANVEPKYPGWGKMRKLPAYFSEKTRY